MQPNQPLVSRMVLLIAILSGGAGFSWILSTAGLSPIWGVAVVAVGSYAVYALISVDALSKTFATMEGNLLFVRRDDKEVGTVDLAQPFNARCIYSSPRVAHYEVKQNGRVVRFVVFTNSDGRLVREGLKLPWPPKLGS